MASSITLKSSSYDGRYMQLVCTQTSNGSAENSSTIKWTLTTAGGSVSNYSTGPTTVVINGSTVYSKDRTAYTTESFPAAKGSKSGTIVVKHNTDGTKKITVSFSTAIYTSTVSKYSDSWTLDPIPRYGTCKHSLNSKTETSVKMNWSSDSTVDYLWYSKDDGKNWTGVNVADGKSGTYTISGLTPYADYKIKTRIRRKDSQLTTDSSTLKVTTYDYPYCTSAPNFTIGEKVTLKFYNPLKRTIKFNIVGDDWTEIVREDWSITGTSYAGVYSTSVQKDLYNTIPNKPTGKYRVRVFCDAVGSEALYDAGNTYSIVPDECVPTINTFYYADTSQAIPSLTGNDQTLVENYSNLSVTIPYANNATAKNGASIVRYEITIDGISKKVEYATSDVTVNVGKIKTDGYKQLCVWVYDSRGLYSFVRKNIAVLDYAKPVINAEIKRLNNFEAQTTLKVSGSYSPVLVNGVRKSGVAGTFYRYRETGATNWSAWTEITTYGDPDYKYHCSDVIITLDNSKSFEFEIWVKDTLTNAVNDPATLIASVGIGQAIFFISTNQKACYINGQKVLMYDVLETWGGW